jgi:hypothetical protein
LGVILLFCGVSFQSVATKEKDDKIELSFSLVDSENSIITEKLSLSRQELNELQDGLTQLIDKLQSVSTDDELTKITESVFMGKRYQPILSLILDLLGQIRIIKNRDFVISQGWNYNFNSNKEQKTSLYKFLNIWYYLPYSSMNFSSRTFILKHSRINFETDSLVGMQIGMMSRFRGIHIYIPRVFPEKSYTFFIGTAKHVVGYDFPAINSMI